MPWNPFRLASGRPDEAAKGPDTNAGSISINTYTPTAKEKKLLTALTVAKGSNVLSLRTLIDAKVDFTDISWEVMEQVLKGLVEEDKLSLQNLKYILAVFKNKKSELVALLRAISDSNQTVIDSIITSTEEKQLIETYDNIDKITNSTDPKIQASENFFEGYSEADNQLLKSISVGSSQDKMNRLAECDFSLVSKRGLIDILDSLIDSDILIEKQVMFFLAAFNIFKLNKDVGALKAVIEQLLEAQYLPHLDDYIEKFKFAFDQITKNYVSEGKVKLALAVNHALYGTSEYLLSKEYWQLDKLKNLKNQDLVKTLIDYIVTYKPLNPSLELLTLIRFAVNNKGSDFLNNFLNPENSENDKFNLGVWVTGQQINRLQNIGFFFSEEEYESKLTDEELRKSLENRWLGINKVTAVVQNLKAIASSFGDKNKQIEQEDKEDAEEDMLSSCAEATSDSDLLLRLTQFNLILVSDEVIQKALDQLAAKNILDMLQFQRLITILNLVKQYPEERLGAEYLLANFLKPENSDVTKIFTRPAVVNTYNSYLLKLKNSYGSIKNNYICEPVDQKKLMIRAAHYGETEFIFTPDYWRGDKAVGVSREDLIKEIVAFVIKYKPTKISKLMYNIIIKSDENIAEIIQKLANGNAKDMTDTASNVDLGEELGFGFDEVSYTKLSAVELEEVLRSSWNSPKFQAGNWTEGVANSEIVINIENLLPNTEAKKVFNLIAKTDFSKLTNQDLARLLSILKDRKLLGSNELNIILVIFQAAKATKDWKSLQNIFKGISKSAFVSHTGNDFYLYNIDNELDVKEIRKFLGDKSKDAMAVILAKFSQNKDRLIYIKDNYLVEDAKLFDLYLNSSIYESNEFILSPKLWTEEKLAKLTNYDLKLKLIEYIARYRPKDPSLNLQTVIAQTIIISEGQLALAELVTSSSIGLNSMTEFTDFLASDQFTTLFNAENYNDFDTSEELYEFFIDIWINSDINFKIKAEAAAETEKQNLAAEQEREWVLNRIAEIVVKPSGGLDFGTNFEKLHGATKGQIIKVVFELIGQSLIKITDENYKYLLSIVRNLREDDEVFAVGTEVKYLDYQSVIKLNRIARVGRVTELNSLEIGAKNSPKSIAQYLFVGADSSVMHRKQEVDETISYPVNSLSIETIRDRREAAFEAAILNFVETNIANKISSVDQRYKNLSRENKVLYSKLYNYLTMMQPEEIVALLTDEDELKLRLNDDQTTTDNAPSLGFDVVDPQRDTSPQVNTSNGTPVDISIEGKARNDIGEILDQQLNGVISEFVEFPQVQIELLPAKTALLTVITGGITINNPIFIKRLKNIFKTNSKFRDISWLLDKMDPNLQAGDLLRQIGAILQQTPAQIIQPIVQNISADVTIPMDSVIRNNSEVKAAYEAVARMLLLPNIEKAKILETVGEQFGDRMKSLVSQMLTAEVISRDDAVRIVHSLIVNALGSIKSNKTPAALKSYLSSGDSTRVWQQAQAAYDNTKTKTLQSKASQKPKTPLALANHDRNVANQILQRADINALVKEIIENFIPGSHYEKIKQLIGLPVASALLHIVATGVEERFINAHDDAAPILIGQGFISDTESDYTNAFKKAKYLLEAYLFNTVLILEVNGATVTMPMIKEYLGDPDNFQQLQTEIVKKAKAEGRIRNTSDYIAKTHKTIKETLVSKTGLSAAVVKGVLASSIFAAAGLVAGNYAPEVMKVVNSNSDLALVFNQIALALKGINLTQNIPLVNIAGAFAGLSAIAGTLGIVLPAWNQAANLLVSKETKQREHALAYQAAVKSLMSNTKIWPDNIKYIKDTVLTAILTDLNVSLKNAQSSEALDKIIDSAQKETSLVRAEFGSTNSPENKLKLDTYIEFVKRLIKLRRQINEAAASKGNFRFGRALENLIRFIPGR